MNDKLTLLIPLRISSFNIGANDFTAVTSKWIVSVASMYKIAGIDFTWQCVKTAKQYYNIVNTQRHLI